MNKDSFNITVTFEGKVIGFANTDNQIDFLSEEDAMKIVTSMGTVVGISSRSIGQVDESGNIVHLSGPQEFAIVKLNDNSE